MAVDLKAQLDKGCAELQLQLSDQQKIQLLDYLALLQKWNKVYNLTSVRDPQGMLTRHILDSLSLATVCWTLEVVLAFQVFQWRSVFRKWR